MILTFSRYLKSILFLTVVTTQALAQEQWQWLNPTMNGNRINNLNLIDGKESIVVSYDYAVLISHDNGRLWSTKPTNFKTTKIIAPSETLSFALTKDGKILKNILSGEPKVVLARSEKDAQFYDIQVDAITGVGLAAGGYEIWVPNGNGGSTIYNWGIVAKTIDFGDTWEIVFEVKGDKIKRFAPVGNRLLAYGTERYNYVIQSVNEGSSWNIIEEFGLGGNYIKGLQFINETTGFLTYEYDKSLYYTKDGGESWQLKNEFSKYLEDITSWGSTVAVQTYNSLLISTDGGTNWTDKILTPDGIRMREIASDQDRMAVIDQDNGLLLSLGTDFNFTNLNKNFDRLAIERDKSYFVYDRNRTVFTSEKIGYTINSDYNSNHTLVKTTDGGCSWQLLSRFWNYTGAKYLYFLNDQVGFASGGDSGTVPTKLQKTVDGGLTWQSCKIGSSASFFISLAFFNETTGIAFTDDNEIFKTTDGGLNWTEITLHPFFGYIGGAKIFIVNETTAYVAQRNDKFFRTTDAGTTWTSVTTGFGLDWTAIHFFDAQNGLMAGYSSNFVNGQLVEKKYLVKTTNGGSTWSKVTDLPNWPNSMKFINATDGYLIGDNGMFLKTTDKGVTWTAEDIVAKVNLNNLYHFDNTLIVTGDEYSVIKRTLAPEANFEPPSPVCEGDSLVILNQSTGAASFLWRLNGDIVSAAENLNIKVEQPGNAKLELVSGDCHLSAYDIHSVSFDVNPKPEKPVLTLNDVLTSIENKLCDSVYTIGSLQHYPRYLWSNGNTESAFTLSNETVLSLQAISDKGCKTTSDTIHFTKQIDPVANFDYHYKWATDEVVFENTSEHADTFEWNFGDGTYSTQPDIQHTFDDHMESYDVTLIATSYCTSDTLTKKLDFKIILGLDESSQRTVEIYPNPVKSSGSLTVQSSEYVYYSILTSKGSVVKPKALMHDATITLPELPPGIYYIFLHNRTGNVKTGKVSIN